MKILLGAELFHADRRTHGQKDSETDMMKLIVAFRNFANKSKSDKEAELNP
jgi:hypothetical protein